MDTVKTQSTFNIENYDPFGKFLRRTLHFSPFWFGLVVLVADLLVDVVFAWHYGIFFGHSGKPGLLQDYTAIVVDFISNPIVCAIYLWTIPGTNRLLEQLYKADIFIPKDTIKNISKQYHSLFASKWAFVSSVFLAVLFVLLQVGGYLHWFSQINGNIGVGGWIELAPSISLARVPFWFITFYALSYAMFNVTVTIIILRKVFQPKKVKIKLLPLHPDRCGGVGSISQYSIKISYAIGTLGLVISAATFYNLNNGKLTTTYDLLLGIAAYVILAPLFFFLPLGTAHEAMREAKDKELLSLAQQFDTRYKQVKISLKKHDAFSEKDTKILEHMKELYKMAEEFPVWPFDTVSLRRFFTVVTTPLLPAIISMIVDVILRLRP